MLWDTYTLLSLLFCWFQPLAQIFYCLISNRKALFGFCSLNKLFLLYWGLNFSINRIHCIVKFMTKRYFTLGWGSQRDTYRQTSDKALCLFVDKRGISFVHVILMHCKDIFRQLEIFSVERKCYKFSGSSTFLPGRQFFTCPLKIYGFGSLVAYLYLEDYTYMIYIHIVIPSRSLIAWKNYLLLTPPTLIRMLVREIGQENSLRGMNLLLIIIPNGSLEVTLKLLKFHSEL